MFCENCGTKNIDGAKFCAGCGSPLTAPQVQPVQETAPQPAGYTYQQPYQPYQPVPAYQPVQPVHQKTAGALVVYIISGALGVLWMLLTVMPQLSVALAGRSLNTYQIIDMMMNLSSDYRIVGAILIVALVIILSLEFVWALLSFLRKKAAGVFGIIASVFAINASIIWAVILTAVIERGGASGLVTAAPAFGIILAVAGFVFAIIELTKKNKV